MPVTGMGPTCICGCGRPAREIGGYSTACWMHLTAGERAFHKWSAEQATEEIDNLEVWWLL